MAAKAHPQSTASAPVSAAIEKAIDLARILRSLEGLPPHPEDKSAVKHKLEAFVAGLKHRYSQRTSAEFPTSPEWELLQQMCFQIAILYGKNPKVDYGSWDSAIKLIEGKYKTLGVRDFIEQILKRIINLPVPPCTTIYQAMEQCSDAKDKTIWQEIYQVIQRQRWTLATDAKPWGEWLKLIATTPIKTREFPRALKDGKSLGQPTACLLFREIHDQQQQWMMDYDRATMASVQFILLLNRDEYFTELKKIFHGDAFSPEQNRTWLKKNKNNDRQKKFAAKRQDRMPRPSVSPV